MLNRIFIFGLLIGGLVAQAAMPAGMAQVETAHDYLIHVWQTDKGLPQNWVSSIAQTPDGYLWVGTRYGGLARFDGVRFVAFNQQNTSELRDVQVEHLSVDETGRLWVIMGNESTTAFQHGHFQLFRQPRAEPRLRLDRVLSVRSNLVLFAGELPYLGKLDMSSSNRWELLDPRSSMAPDAPTFSMDHDDVVWLITQDKRLAHFATNSFASVSTGLPETNAVALALDVNRQIWVATPHHLATWNGHSFLDCTPTMPTLDPTYPGTTNGTFVLTGATGSLGDADSDGLPDDWEFRELLTYQYNGNDDPSQSGKTLAQTYAQNLDPLVPNAYRINTITPVGTNQLQLTWNSTPGASFTVEVSSNLVDWVPAQTVAAGDVFYGTATINIAAPQDFFRVRKQ